MSALDNALGVASLATAAWVALGAGDHEDNIEDSSGQEVKMLTVESVSDGVCIYQMSADNIQEVASTESVSGTGFVQDAVAPNSPVDVYSFSGELTLKADFPDRAVFEVTDGGGTTEVTPDPLTDGIIEV